MEKRKSKIYLYTDLCISVDLLDFAIDGNAHKKVNLLLNARKKIEK